MLDLAIMLEGQNGLNWPRFKRIAQAVEDLDFAGLYRSDHYTNAGPPDLDSLELWVSLTWLASNTSRIDFGPLVTPVSFRHPTLTARMAAAVDDLSGGRLWLGLGAGWQDREHHNFGRDLLSEPERFQRFDEGLEVITRLLAQRRAGQLCGPLLLPRRGDPAAAPAAARRPADPSRRQRHEVHPAARGEIRREMELRLPPPGPVQEEEREARRRCWPRRAASPATCTAR